MSRSAARQATWFTLAALLLTGARSAQAGERVINGDFSNGGAGWMPWIFVGTPNASYVSGQCPAGASAPCLRVNSDSATFVGGVYQQIRVVPGATYAVNASSRDLNPDNSQAAVWILVGTTPPQNGQDYADDGTAGSDPQQLLAWNSAACRGWNGDASTACGQPLRFTFTATAPVMYLVIKFGFNRFDISVDNLSAEGPDPCVIYVDANAQGAGNGTSWRDAFKNLQPALAAAANSPCPRDELWVANGVYQPLDVLDPEDPRSAAFQLRDHVELYGGFEGASDPEIYAPDGETHRGQRNPANPANATILTNSSSNSRYVVAIAGTTPTGAPVLDGFVIRAADGPDLCTSEFRVTSPAFIFNNTIDSRGDQYLNIDPDPTVPSSQRAEVAGNRLRLRVDEGRLETPGTLLELRSPDLNCAGNCPPGAVQLTTSPGYQDPWSLEALDVLPNARVHLTNRPGFAFQQNPEALYVKTLILRGNAQLNLNGQRLYYQQLSQDDTSRIVNYPLPGYDLGRLDMNDPEAAACQIAGRDHEPGEQGRGSITFVPDVRGPGDGVLRMQIQQPGTQMPATSVAARAPFRRVGEGAVTIDFEYRFRANPDSLLIVRLGDEPKVGHAHAAEVAHLRPSNPGRAGAVNHDGFARFRRTFHPDLFNLRRGTFVELELGRGGFGQKTATDAVASSTSSSSDEPIVEIDNWGATITCTACADLNGSSGLVDSADYLLLLAHYGQTIEDAGEGHYCLDQMFGGDGYVDLFDLLAWDLFLDPLNPLPNLCGESPAGTTSLDSFSLEEVESSAASTAALSRLRVAGKPNHGGFSRQYDYLYELDPDGACVSTAVNPGCPTICRRGNGKLIQDRYGTLYRLHGQQGIIRDSDAFVVAAPCFMATGSGSCSDPPGEGTYVGTQITLDDEIVGLPIADAAFSRTEDDVVYVTPVLLNPSWAQCPYKAAAKLQLDGTGGYTVLATYGANPAADPRLTVAPPLPPDCEGVLEPDFQGLREIETDADGNLFVLAAQATNDNDRILIYDESDPASEIEILLSDLFVGALPAPEGPLAMLVSTFDPDKLYLSSSVSHDGTGRTRIYRLTINRLPNGAATGLTLDGAVDVLHPMNVSPSGVPDVIELSAISSSGLPGEIQLAWLSPGPYTIHVRRQTGTWPLGPLDGTAVYSGPAAGVSDAGLVPGTTYYYAAYVESAGVYSDGVFTRATAGLPPGGSSGCLATVTGLTEDYDGTLRVTGFTAPRSPAELPTSHPLYAQRFGGTSVLFTSATLAAVTRCATWSTVPASVETVAATLITDAGCDLALPVGAVIPGEGLKLISAASRKIHGAAGTYDIVLPIDPPSAAGIECRANGPTQVVLTFSADIQVLDGTPDASEISLSCGCSGPCGIVNSVSVSADSMTVNLSGVPDETCLALSVTGIADLANVPLAGDNTVHICALHGDTNADRQVASGDITQVKSRSGQTCNITNYRYDLNADGVIASGDITQVKSRSGNSTQCP